MHLKRSMLLFVLKLGLGTSDWVYSQTWRTSGIGELALVNEQCCISSVCSSAISLQFSPAAPMFLQFWTSPQQTLLTVFLQLHFVMILHDFTWLMGAALA